MGPFLFGIVVGMITFMFLSPAPSIVCRAAFHADQADASIQWQDGKCVQVTVKEIEQ